MSKKIPSGIIRQLFTLLIIVLFFYVISVQMLPYLGGILGAITLYVLLVNFQKKLEKKNWKPSLAALTLIFISTITILAPIMGIGFLFTSRVKKLVSNKSVIEQKVKSQIDSIEQYVGYDLSGQVDSSEISSYISGTLTGLVSGSLTVFIAISLMLFLLYFMLVKRDVWLKAALEYLPLRKDNIETIGTKSRELVKSNALGIPLVAILQGVIALIGYYIFGVDNPLFWFVITTIGSMIPFIGTTLGIVPVCLLLLSQGETGNAVGMLIYGIAVVGATDNVFRLVVQRKLADIHPLITLFGVLVGVPLFGFIGLVFGPLLVSSFLLLVRIYKDEYGREKVQEL
ncbi:MAG: AI-2E family transporter [Nonlabens sp.]